MRHACLPTSMACAGQFTANTMGMASEASSLAPTGSSLEGHAAPESKLVPDLPHARPFDGDMVSLNARTAVRRMAAEPTNGETVSPLPAMGKTLTVHWGDLLENAR